MHTTLIVPNHWYNSSCRAKVCFSTEVHSFLSCTFLPQTLKPFSHILGCTPLAFIDYVHVCVASYRNADIPSVGKILPMQ